MRIHQATSLFFLIFFPDFLNPLIRNLHLLKKKGFLLEYLCASILSEEINDNFFFIIQKKKLPVRVVNPSLPRSAASSRISTE